MILEHVLITLQPGDKESYLRDFNVAKPLVEQQGGCRSCRLLPALDDENSLLLLIEWEKQSDHTEGFRKSEEYKEWSRLLHPYYVVFPEVRYFNARC